MSYIGNTSTTQSFTPAIDYFSGNGSTTAFTLSRPVASVAQVQVVIDNVAQNPSSAYTVSANTITFTSAPLSGTNNIYVYYTSPITQVIAPGQGTVNATSLASSTGSGAVVLATSPTLVTPALGTPSALVLTNATALPKAALPTGSVLQVVNATTTAAITTTSTSFVTTGFSLSITPTSSASKIFALVNGGGGYNGGVAQSLWATIYRGSTNLGDATYGLERVYAGSSATMAPHSMTVLDSPATTSSTTYTCYFKSNSSGQVDFSNADRGTVSFTLMEIAA